MKKQIKRTCTVITDEITEKLSSSFDYSFNGTSEFIAPNFDKEDLDPEFQIGLIVGPSGSGKSTILNEHFGVEEELTWSQDKAICSHFQTAEDAQKKLGAVGLNSIPTWMKPYHVLSEGEKFRAKIARLLKDNAVIDEFTSVVDRKVAVACAYSVSRYIRKENLKNIVFSSCHHDILEYLSPDWVLNTMEFDEEGHKVSTERCLRPDIILEAVPCSARAWSNFSPHHYLSQKINSSSRCWLIYWKEQQTVIGFTSCLAQPSGTIKNAWREHRTVVLPEYQGLGFGVRISDLMGEIFTKQGCRYFSKTAHPRMGEYRENSVLWKGTSKNKKKRKDYISMSVDEKKHSKEHLAKHSDRLCYSHEFIGGITR